MENDLISRQEAIDALWKALYEYEDETEKQFQESEDLDIRDWILHRIFVQNMNDIDRQTIIKLQSAQPEIDILSWLLAYHTKSFELQGRYKAHEVIGWLVHDFATAYMAERQEDEVDS